MNIEVNGSTITEALIDQEVQYHPSSTLDEARRLAARALVIREVLLQQAQHLDIDAPDTAGVSETEDEALIRVLIEREVEIPTADEPTCRRYFASHPRQFRSPDIFEVSHILIAADPNDAKVRADAQQRATSLLDELHGRVDQFADLAAEVSDCPSKNAGGNLGQISRGQTVPEFETALQRLTPGTLCAHPVESRYGFHIIYLHQRIDGIPLAYEQVCDRIANYLNESVRRRAINQYLQILIGNAEITGIELGGTESALVQ